MTQSEPESDFFFATKLRGELTYPHSDQDFGGRKSETVMHPLKHAPLYFSDKEDGTPHVY